MTPAVDFVSVREDDVSSDALELPMESPETVSPPATEGTVEYPERLLLSRLKRGDAQAFEMLVKGHQHRVYDFCVRMMVDREEAFDLTQEIFLSIHQHLGDFRHDAKLSTWIFCIAKNHCLNRL